MNILNFKAGIKNPLIPFASANWYQSKVNIIYIPFMTASFNNWYLAEQQFKQHYRTIIIPDKVQLGGIAVRKIQNYISALKKQIKGVRVEKIVKNSINQPVIVDLSPVANTFWQMINSRGIKYIAPDFFNFINSIYTMLMSADQLRASETVIVFDFNGEYQDLDSLLLYLKLNDYKFPSQISDRYVFLHLKNYYLTLTTDSSMQISKPIYSKLVKIVSDKDDEKVLKLLQDPSKQVDEGQVSSKTITADIIKSTLLKKFNKKINDGLELNSIVNITQTFIQKHPDMNVNLGDSNDVANLIKEALKNEIKISDNKPISFDELLADHRKQFVYKMNINSSTIHNKKVSGINGLKATGVQWVTDPNRTKIEFDENLDRNIEKMIESLDDSKFGLHVQGISRDIKDDGRSRVYIYKIKIKPDKGRAYTTNLYVPALVHDTYFKTGGNLYAINNQLMQLPIIKKNPSTVQLKTNYSVTDYTIKSFPKTIKSFDDIVNKFLNIMKSTKKLKTADIMDQATEARLKDYGIPANEIAKINYKKIEVS